MLRFYSDRNGLRAQTPHKPFGGRGERLLFRYDDFGVPNFFLSLLRVSPVREKNRARM
jgi:hypothetical protein